MGYREEYERWLESANEEIKEELKNYSKKEIEDSFYRNLAFGTGGLRGEIGAGTNKMNIYTVGKATQGLANYLKEGASVVIGYDSRIKSDLFAKTAASVFAANHIHVYIWPVLLPVPTVSFAVRHLGASAGVMITASHNPSKYNGYKVYGPDGCQITTETAGEILSEIEKIDIFDGVEGKKFKTALEEGEIEYIKEDVLTVFIDEVKHQSVLYGEEVNKDVAIVYSPLNGAGLVPVTRVLKEMGYTNITLVEEQRLPDGNFPTCPYPNPEIREALSLGLEYCKKYNADLMLATDPDCDRVGIAVKNGEDYTLLSGNEVGMLLLDYICSQRIKHDRMPQNPLLIKTIVTIDMAEQIARDYGVKTINVLTGFKFIGEQIGILEKKGEGDRYIFGFEESYGYLSGGYVRDKDGVNGAYLICEMFAYYKTKGKSLVERLNELYDKYGYCLNTLHSYTFEGASGFEKMRKIMKMFHEKGIEGISYQEVEDYSKGLNGLPKSDVLKYKMEHGSIVVRPSGTEPKLKTYISVSAKTKELATEEEKNVCEVLRKMFLI